MKLNYNPYKNNDATPQSEKETSQGLDYQLFNDFQNGLKSDLEQKKQDIELAKGNQVQGGETVS